MSRGAIKLPSYFLLLAIALILDFFGIILSLLLVPAFSPMALVISGASLLISKGISFVVGDNLASQILEAPLLLQVALISLPFLLSLMFLLLITMTFYSNKKPILSLDYLKVCVVFFLESFLFFLNSLPGWTLLIIYLMRKDVFKLSRRTISKNKIV